MTEEINLEETQEIVTEEVTEEAPATLEEVMQATVPEVNTEEVTEESNNNPAKIDIRYVPKVQAKEVPKQIQLARNGRDPSENIKKGDLLRRGAK